MAGVHFKESWNHNRTIFKVRRTEKNLWSRQASEPVLFRSDEVRKVIDQTNIFPPKQKESLTAQITGFFRLMGKTSMNPVVLENLETLEEW